MPATKGKNVNPASWWLVTVAWFGDVFLNDLSNCFCLPQPCPYQILEMNIPSSEDTEQHLSFMSTSERQQGELTAILNFSEHTHTHTFTHPYLSWRLYKVEWLIKIFNCGELECFRSIVKLSWGIFNSLRRHSLSTDVSNLIAFWL